jgi:hypothetical protein
MTGRLLVRHREGDDFLHRLDVVREEIVVGAAAELFVVHDCDNVNAGVDVSLRI